MHSITLYYIYTHSQNNPKALKIFDGFVAQPNHTSYSVITSWEKWFVRVPPVKIKVG